MAEDSLGIDDIVYVAKYSSSEEDNQSSLQDEERRTIAHPSLEENWNAMSLPQRSEALFKFKKRQKNAANERRRRELRQKLKDEVYDWELKPRRTDEVTGNVDLSLGNPFATRQSFQLRVAEVCNHLSKIPLWSAVKNDPRSKKGECNAGAACARSVDPSDDFIACAVRTSDGWKVVDHNLA